MAAKKEPTSSSPSRPYRDYANEPLVSPEEREANTHKPGGDFPMQLHMMLTRAEEHGYSEVCSWRPHGRAFMVHDRAAFVEKVMPIYFRTNKFASFQRQLNMYGFSRISARGDDYSGYFHELFLRGRPDLCSRLFRVVKSPAPSSPQSLPEEKAPKVQPDFSRLAPVGVGADRKEVTSKASRSDPFASQHLYVNNPSGLTWSAPVGPPSRAYSAITRPNSDSSITLQQHRHARPSSWPEHGLLPMAPHQEQGFFCNPRLESVFHEMFPPKHQQRTAPESAAAFNNIRRSNSLPVGTFAEEAPSPPQLVSGPIHSAISSPNNAVPPLLVAQLPSGDGAAPRQRAQRWGVSLPHQFQQLPVAASHHRHRELPQGHYYYYQQVASPSPLMAVPSSVFDLQQPVQYSAMTEAASGVAGKADCSKEDAGAASCCAIKADPVGEKPNIQDMPLVEVLQMGAWLQDIDMDLSDGETDDPDW